MTKPTIKRMIRFLNNEASNCGTQEDHMVDMYEAIRDRLKQLSTPDMFIIDGSDDSYMSLSDVSDYFCEGEIRELQCMREFPNMFAVHIIGENYLFATEEEAEQFLERNK